MLGASPEGRRAVPGVRGVIMLAILLAIGAGAGWYFWTRQHAQPAGRTGGGGRGAQTAPQPVGAATIDKGDIRIILNELGTVTSLDMVTVLAQTTGQLVEVGVGFKEGQVVKKGDFLAQIDPRPYQAALDQAQGTLAHDQGIAEPGADRPVGNSTRHWDGKTRSPNNNWTISAFWWPSTPARCRPIRVPWTTRNSTWRTATSSHPSTGRSGCVRSIRATTSRLAAPAALSS